MAMGIHVMPAEFVILLLINAVVGDLIPSTSGVLPTIPSSENQPLVPQHEEPLQNQVAETNYENVIEIQKEEATPCYSTKVLVPILNQLLNLLMQDPSNVNKVSRISALLQEYLKNMHDGNDKQNGEADKDSLRSAYYGPKGQIKTKIAFKYELPSIDQPHCRDVFMKLIKSAYDAYVELAKHPLCNSGYSGTINKPYAYNLNTLNLPSGKEYSMYDVLKPPAQNLQYQGQKYVNEHPSVYNDYKVLNPNGDYSNMGYLESKTMDSAKKPQDYSPYDYGKNINTLTPHGVTYYRPEVGSKDLNKDYIHNLYDNGKPVPPDGRPSKEDNYPLFPYNDANLKYPDYSKPVSHLIDSMHQQPADLGPSLPTGKTPGVQDDMQDKIVQLSYQENYPVLNDASSQKYYPYQNQQEANLNQIPTQNENVNSYQNYNPMYKYISGYDLPNESSLKPMQTVYNNYLNKLNVVPNLQQIYGVPNSFKLDPSANAGVIELTYVVKRATPLIYQPLYFVKFRIPYSKFLYNIRNLLITKPYLKINPMKLYQEVIAESNVTDVSPGLKGYKKEDILKLAYKNGELVTAKLVKEDNALNEQLQLIQKLNSGIGAVDILDLNKNNVFLKSGADKGNVSDSLSVGRYGNFVKPYFDLSSAGIGFNSQASRYSSYQGINPSLYRPVSVSPYGRNVIQPTPYLNAVASAKANVGAFGVSG